MPATEQELRDRVVRSARSLLGTPWQHKGRIPGVCIDDIGFLAHVTSVALFEIPQYSTEYPKVFAGHYYQAEVTKGLVPKSFAQLTDGDVILFCVDVPRIPCHIGLKTDKGLLHVYKRYRVVEHELSKFWVDRIDSIFSFKEIMQVGATNGIS